MGTCDEAKGSNVETCDEDSKGNVGTCDAMWGHVMKQKRVGLGWGLEWVWGTRV